MDLHQLRLFEALASTGSFSKAAALCHISQPALWIQIKNLEDEYHVALVDRFPRGIQLTEAGRLVYDYSRKLFGLVNEMNTAVRELAGLKRGKLLIGASTTPGTYTLPDALGRFKAQYPGIELDLRIANTLQVEEWVLNRELVIGIIGQEPSHRDLRWEPYLKDVLVLIVPPGHRFAKRKSISIRELSRETFLIRESGSNTRKTCEEAFRRHGLSLPLVMELGSTEAIKRAVAANLGVSIVSPYALAWELQYGQLAAIRVRESGFERQFNLIYHSRRQLPAAAQAFAEMLKAVSGPKGRRLHSII